MENKISTQKTHELGIEAAVAAAKNSKNNVLIRSLQDPNKYFIISDKFYGAHEVIFKCSRADKNPGRVQTNVSKNEYKNRYTNVGQYDDKVYILVHLDTATGKNRFFCISHKDLVTLQFCIDRDNGNTERRPYTFKRWLCDGDGRNNMDIATLAEQDCEIWN